MRSLAQGLPSAILTDVAQEGWKLIHTSATAVAMGSVSTSRGEVFVGIVLAALRPLETAW